MQVVAPRYVEPGLQSGRDLWGVVYRPQSYAGGAGKYDEVAHFPLAAMTDPVELEDDPWPTPDGFDCSLIPTEIERLRE